MLITEELKRLQTGPRELRNFGLLVGGVFTAIGLWMLWRGKGVPYVFMVPGGLLMLLGLAVPFTLRKIYKVWMGMALILGLIMSTILLTLFFYLFLTPIGLLARLVGKDFLLLKKSPADSTFWIARERRSFDRKSMEQQF